MTFVKGDRVRYRSAPPPGIVEGQWTSNWSGKTGIVRGHRVDALTHVTWDEGGDAFPNTFNLEKIEMTTFKIGDRVRYTGNHPDTNDTQYLGATGTVVVDKHPGRAFSNVQVKWDNPKAVGLATSNGERGVFPENLELIAPRIDTAKPMKVRGTMGSDRDVVFVTMTSEGHILVTEPGRTGWMMFDINGNFMRSDNGGGSALRLTNKPVSTVEYIAITKSGAPVINNPGYANRALAWDTNPEADHLVQIDKLDGVVVGVGVLKRQS